FLRDRGDASCQPLPLFPRLLLPAGSVVGGGPSDDAGTGRGDIGASTLMGTDNSRIFSSAWSPPASHARGLGLAVPAHASLFCCRFGSAAIIRPGHREFWASIADRGHSGSWILGEHDYRD